MTQQSLIIFTRYPEIGKAKTRLIPAIGAEKATNLHRQMTELTVKKTLELSQKLELNIHVYFVDGDIDLMRLWLGNNLNFQPQSLGDLGEKMYSALKDRFLANDTEIIIIGTDCPSLNVEILLVAFEQLKNHDLVIGKAEDGGYYLIGLKSLAKDLFTNINWSTAQVFQQTISIAQKLNLTIYDNLPILRDIDTCEDLQFYQNDQNKLFS